MADTKISGLTALTGANVDVTSDLIAIVDGSATETKKITVNELFESQITGISNMLMGTPSHNITCLSYGRDSGGANTSGIQWMASGYQSAAANTSGNNWAAFGFRAGYSNTGGSNWLALGSRAGYSNTGGSNWFAQGNQAGYFNTTGSSWLALGTQAGYSNAAGSSWLALGFRAARYLANGTTEATDFDDCIYIGTDTKVSAEGVSNEIAIGDAVTGGGSNTVTIGNSTNTFNFFTGGASFTSTENGVILPRMTTTQRNNIGSPTNGETIYNTTTNKLNFYNGSTWKAVTSA